MPENQQTENAYWNPAWQRKQKRTTGATQPINQITPEALQEQIKSRIPESSLKRHSKLTPEEFTQLIEALEFYAISDSNAYSDSFFLCKFTKLSPSYISNYFEENKENPLITSTKSTYSRARSIFEHNLASKHANSNPQFAQFLLKNKFGYVDKTEGGGNTTNIAIDARTFLQQLGRLPEKQGENPGIAEAVETKQLTSNQ